MDELLSALSSQAEAALSRTERQRLALLDVQARHAKKLGNTVMLQIAAREADLPVSDNLHISVYRWLGMVAGQREEVGGLRFKDTSRPDGEEVFVEVFTTEGNSPMEPVGDFSMHHCLLVAGMIAELDWLVASRELELRPDLTELASRQDGLD